MANQPLFRVNNVNKALSAIRRTQTGIRQEMERASNRIAADFIGQARTKAQRSRRSATVAQSLRIRKGIVPKVAVGGGATFPSTTPRRRRATFGDVFWGSEFGSAQYRQFPPPTRYAGGYWFYAALGANGYRYVNWWLGAFDKAARRWGPPYTGPIPRS